MQLSQRRNSFRRPIGDRTMFADRDTVANVADDE